MDVIKMPQIPTFTSPAGHTVRKLLEHASFLVMNLLLVPGEKVEKHVTPVDLIFLVLKGRGTIYIGDEEAAVEETDMVFSPKNISRGLAASEEGAFHVLVIRNPLSEAAV